MINIRKGIALTTALASFALSGAGEAEAASIDVCAVPLGTQNVNIRTGPGTQFPAVGVVSSDKVTKVLSDPDENGWTLVLQEGQELYVKSELTQERLCDEISAGLVRERMQVDPNLVFLGHRAIEGEAGTLHIFGHSTIFTDNTLYAIYALAREYTEELGGAHAFGYNRANPSALVFLPDAEAYKLFGPVYDVGGAFANTLKLVDGVLLSRDIQRYNGETLNAAVIGLDDPNFPASEDEAKKMVHELLHVLGQPHMGDPGDELNANIGGSVAAAVYTRPLTWEANLTMMNHLNKYPLFRDFGKRLARIIWGGTVSADMPLIVPDNSNCEPQMLFAQSRGEQVTQEMCAVPPSVLAAQFASIEP